MELGSDGNPNAGLVKARIAASEFADNGFSLLLKRSSQAAKCCGHPRHAMIHNSYS